MKQTYKLKLITTISLLGYATQAFAQKEDITTIFDMQHLAAYLVAGLLIAIFVMIFTNRLYYYQQKAVSQEAQQQSTQLSLVLDYNKFQIWTYDVEKEFFTQFTNQGENHVTYSPIEFSMLYDHDDFSKMLKSIVNISQGQKESDVKTVRSRKPEDDQPDMQQHLFRISISVLKSNLQGKPSVILGIQKDITEENKISGGIKWDLLTPN